MDQSFRYSLQGTPKNKNIRSTNFEVERGVVINTLKTAPVAHDVRNETPSNYNGKLKRWPGVLLLLFLTFASIGLVVYGAMSKSNEANALNKDFLRRQQAARTIQDGLGTADIISADGQINNPAVYPQQNCSLPNYVSKNGKIIAISPNGTEVPIGIKGVNWFGMEGGLNIPFGMWDNEQNGTTAFEIASFLQRNKFNAVRLPVCISSILANTPPQKGLINLETNRAFDATSYISTLQSVIKALAFRQIGVLISLHTLSSTVTGDLWYNEAAGVSEENFLSAVDILTKNLCSDEYWNIMGLDVKNEPYKASWGTGRKDDFAIGSTLISNRMLKGCSKWLAFVEGVNAAHTVTIDGTAISYSDWYGGGLQMVRKHGITLASPDKLVWAPHYYTSAISPQMYFYDGGSVGAGRVIANYKELDNATLKARVAGTMYDMFGYLASKTGSALLLGEFAGLYTKDAHPQKTVQRTTDYTIQEMLTGGYAGGFMWSLNPESIYEFNPADSNKPTTEGLLMDNWRDPNKDFLSGMAAMDAFQDLKQFPCF